MPRITMTHATLPGRTKVVDQLAYRRVYWELGWRSDDDPYEGPGTAPPPATTLEAHIAQRGPGAHLPVGGVLGDVVTRTSGGAAWQAPTGGGGPGGVVDGGGPDDDGDAIDGGSP